MTPVEVLRWLIWRPNKGTVDSCRFCGGWRDEEPAHRKNCPSLAIDAVLAEREQLRAEVAASQKWSRRWKRLADWRGWPAQKHEQTRRQLQQAAARAEEYHHSLTEAMKVIHEEQARVERLRRGMSQLLDAVTFGPPCDLPGNAGIGYRARVPMDFVTQARAALFEEER